MSAAQEIDDSLYSRQRYVLGDQAMKAMAASNVFLSGLGGLGIEIAKNIALAGIRSLTIHDEVNATLADLGTQFYLSEKTINQNRAAASLDQLTSLNPYVKIQVSTEKLDNIDLEYFSQFKCVILTESKLETQLRINKYCHEHKIGFITADVRGVFCWSFVDFAPGFVVTDSNGERPSEIMVAHISNAEQAVISCLEHHFHNLETGDVVQFSDLTGQGYQSLNGNQYRITVIDPYNFSIEVDSREFPPFERGKALAVQVKIPLIIDFLSLEESLKQPELLFPDLGKFDNPWKSFLAIRALYSFQESQGKLPGVWNKSDAEQLVDLAKKFQSAHELSDDMLSPNLISALSFTAQGSLSCFTSFLGGTVAQEVLKALSGKFLPIKQWLILDALEILPSNAFDQDFNPSEFLPKNDRYDQLRICVGESVCSKLRQTKLFMVGAGAIGCEMMKNYALLGVSTKQDQGVIHLTDNDLIEKSNLNRQFLFRPNNIQEAKSSTAASAVLAMNQDLNIVSYLDKVGPQTQAKFSDEFLSSLDICVNALDNVEARLYMDMRAVANQRPLLESGTLATKGHVQVVVPFLTESYASQSDPRSNDIPFCTLKSFPNSIDHCIIWARDMAFEEYFVSKPRDVRLYHETQNLAERLRSKDMELLRCLPSVSKVLEGKPNSFEECIAFARKFFEESYHNIILQLLKNFPLDHRMNDGSLFWALPRRAPTPLRFDSSDERHLDFVYYFALLWAQVWHVPSFDDRQRIAQVADQVQIETFVPKDNAEIETDEKAEKPKGKEETIDESSLDGTIERVIQFFQSNQDFRVSPVDFEKDDDRNHHIDFINAAANLRARCYSIPEAPRLETKRIAGNITPAIATTTAAVAGLVSLELIKIRMGLPFESYRNTFMNLAISVFYLSEPGPAKKTPVTKKISITLWDRWDVRGYAEFTLQNLFDYFKNKYHLTIVGVLQDSTMVYIPMPMYNKRLGNPLRDLLKDSGLGYANVVLNFADSKGNQISGPPVRYYFTGGDPSILTKSKKSKDKKSSSKSDKKSKDSKKGDKEKKSDSKKSDKKESKKEGKKGEKKHSGSKRKHAPSEDPSPSKPKKAK